MAMGLSTQTGPLRPSCPSYSLFSRSCSRPSSFPFSWSLLASSKALHREGGWTIQNNKNYQTMSKSWRLLCLSNSAKMVFYSIDQDNSSAVVADKSADLGGIREWKEEVKRVRSTRQAGSNPPRGMSSRASSRNVGRQSINHAAPVSALKPASATSSGPASTGNVRIVSQPIVFPSRNLDEIKETSSEVNVNGLNLDQSRPGLCSTDNSQKLAQLSVSTDGLDKTSTSNEAYRQPDLHERLKSNPPRRTSSRASSRNAGRQSISHAAPVSASKPASATPSGLASTDNVRIVAQPSLVESRNLEEIKETSSEVNVNGLSLDQSRSGLCSTDNSQKVAQPSVSTDGLDKTSTSNEAYRQPDLLERLNSIYDSVLVVDNITVAKEVVGMLTNKYRHLVHACDTEVAKIDVKQETPVDHGEIICFSIYSGPEADLGNGKSCVWVDVLDGGGRDLLVEFAPFFEDPSIKKVWHNYSFDNHVIENYGLRLSGFHADTMHMARLWDSSRRTEGGYSLEALTGNKRVMCGAQLCHEQELFGKVSMKTIFGRRKIKKDGSAGKMITISPVEEIQREERKPWICYSALDAKSTLKLYESLKCKLSKMPWVFNDKKISGKSMFDFYEEYWRPFGELLVKMETEGMLVDRAYLAEVEKVAKAEHVVAASRFRNWASRYCPDAKYMNVGSDTQLRQLFFGGIANRKEHYKFLPIGRIFKVPNVDEVIEDGKKTPTKFCNIRLHRILDVPLPTDTFTATGWPSVSGDALKTLAGKVSAEYDFMDDASDQELDYNVENASENEGSEKQKSTDDVEKSAYGTAFRAFEEEEENGKEACHAIAALCEVCSIDSLISNFILPLQGSNISGSNGRIHCSLNINTETGRLSTRRPNLQNMPALEKGRYKIHQAFIAAPGNSLIVADYGQLELRILAHLASCKSMLDAFRAGGDFHSRTAMNMYPYIREAIDKKQVLLDWHPRPGEEKPPVPLLKDAFASERRKAKMLNFSVAYGKTPMGLAQDWKVSVEEAKQTVGLWYSNRKEVLTWQKKHIQQARDLRFVRTLLGRAHRFPSKYNVSTYKKGHIERAAIKTLVQGSAADVAMCAMLEISKNVRLKELGWKLLLKVHDGVILEGPTETAEVAKAIVIECMSKPFNGENFLQVDLSVDAKCAKDWYSAK